MWMIKGYHWLTQGQNAACTFYEAASGWPSSGDSRHTYASRSSSILSCQLFHKSLHWGKNIVWMHCYLISSSCAFDLIEIQPVGDNLEMCFEWKYCLSNECKHGICWSRILMFVFVLKLLEGRHAEYRFSSSWCWAPSNIIARLGADLCWNFAGRRV